MSDMSIAYDKQPIQRRSEEREASGRHSAI